MLPLCPEAVKADPKKNPLTPFKLLFEKVKDHTGAGDIGGADHLKSLEATIKWLVASRNAVMGWRQSASMQDVINEIEDNVTRYYELLLLIEEDKIAFNEMVADMRKGQKIEYRAERHQKGKVEKPFLAAGCTVPVASSFTKVLKSDDQCIVPFNESLKVACSVKMQGDNADDVGKQLLAYTVKYEQLHKKSANLVAKLKGPAGMSCKSQVCAEPLTSGHSIFSSLGDAGIELLARPTLVAVKEHSYTWHPNAWPAVGVPCFVVCVAGKMVINVLDVDELVDKGCKALVSLTSMDMFKGSDTKPINSFPKTSLELDSGVAAFLPAGSVPMVTGVCNSESPSDVDQACNGSVVALVIPMLCGAEIMKKKTEESRFQIKQYIELGLKGPDCDKEPMLTVARLTKAWVETWSK